MANKKKYAKFTASPKGMFHSMKQNSRKAKRLFNLTQIDFLKWYEVQSKKCFYCGIPKEKLYLLPKKGRYINARFSIDRLDSNKGYELNNMVLACNICNAVKSNLLTAEEMIIIGKIVIRKKWKKEKFPS